MSRPTERAEAAFVWTEDAVRSLPAEEHDYFDRKSGALLKASHWRHEFAKSLSAFANSGGGILVLGVQDDGIIDGVDAFHKGRTTTREWLEQVIPRLTEPMLTDFSVQSITGGPDSAIPTSRQIIVIDVGDSPIAPHQSAEDKIYYHRSAGHSLPASHHYLEMLRNRRVGPALQVAMLNIQVRDGRYLDGTMYVDCDLVYKVINTGRSASYRHQVVLLEWPQISGREKDRRSGARNPWRGTIQTDSSILPSLCVEDRQSLDLVLRLPDVSVETIQSELELFLPSNDSFSYRVVSEAAVGEAVETRIADVFDSTAAAQALYRLFVKAQIERGLLPPSALPPQLSG